MEPAAEESPAKEEAPVKEEEVKLPEGAAPPDEEALGDLEGFIQLEVQDSEGRWGRIREDEEGNRGPRMNHVVLDLIAFLLDGVFFRRMYDQLMRKRVSDKRAKSAQAGVMKQLDQYVRETCNQRVKHRNWMEESLLGTEHGREGRAIMDVIDAQGKNYTWALYRLTRTSMSVADHKDAIAKFVAKFARALTSDLIAKLRALAPWMPQEGQAALVDIVLQADLKARNIL